MAKGGENLVRVAAQEQTIAVHQKVGVILGRPVVVVRNRPIPDLVPSPVQRHIGRNDHFSHLLSPSVWSLILGSFKAGDSSAGQPTRPRSPPRPRRVSRNQHAAMAASSAAALAATRSSSSSSRASSSLGLKCRDGAGASAGADRPLSHQLLTSQETKSEERRGGKEGRTRRSPYH